MMIDRRRFLALSLMGAAAVACSRPTNGASTVAVGVTPSETDVDLGGVTVRTWAYNGRVPAREIRLFEPPDSGTYWLHSHVGTQLDRGLYGPLIIEDPNEKADWDDELVVALDDWIDSTGTNPDQVLENLKKNGMAKMGPAEAGAGVTRRHLWVMTAATLPTRTTWSTVGSPRTRKWSITGPERVFGFGLSTPPPTPRSVSRCPARR